MRRPDRAARPRAAVHPARAGLVALGLLCAATPTHAAAQEIVVTLLGTGSPALSTARYGPSILVQAGGENLVFDAGRGAIVRLAQAGVVRPSAVAPAPAAAGAAAGVSALFLTHLHSDHVNGLADLWLTGWLMGGRRTPLELWGPPGTTELATHLEAAFAFDRKVRAAEGLPESGGHLVAHDIPPGFVWERSGVRVTAIEVDHSDIVRPAYGYRIDYAGRSVVLSGDTRYSPTLVKAATGVDLLVHEVAATFESPDSARRGILRVWHHTNPPEAGDVFRQAHPRLAVYSHIVTPLPDSALVRLTRRSYAGPLVVGADLMRFHVGAGVTAERVGPDSARAVVIER